MRHHLLRRLTTGHWPLATLLLVVAAALAVVLATWAPRAGRAESSRNDRMGIVHINSTEITASAAGRAERYRLAAEAGAGWSRWPIYWPLIESRAGFNWSGADAVVLGDVENGFQVDAILLSTPAEYATGGAAGVPGPRVGQRPRPGLELAGTSPLASAPANLYLPVFADGSDVPAPGKAINPQNYWARFVFKAANRYKPGGELAAQRGWPAGRGIRTWEIWNEPDFSFFWSGSVPDYYRLLKVAGLAIRQADPQAQLLMGGLMHWSNPGWLEALLQEMGRDPARAQAEAQGFYFDVVPFHWYSDPRHQYDRTAEARVLLAKYGLGGKHIWVNESNVPVWDDYPGPTHDPHSPGRATIQEAADYIVQATAYAFAAGVERVFTFQLHDDCGNGPDSYDAFGLVRNTREAVGSGVCAPHPSLPGIPRPAYTAYKVTAEQLRDATFAWRQRTGDVEQIAFTRPAGDLVRVMWNWSTSPVAVQVTATAASAVQIDPLGNSVALSAAAGRYSFVLSGATNTNSFGAPGAVMIGGRPVFVVEQPNSCAVDTTRPTSTMAALPPASPDHFTVSWSGQDNCQVSRYLVWWTDGDPTLTTTVKHRFFNADPAGWTTRTQADFPDDLTEPPPGFQVQSDHTYYFGVLAYDAAGNREENVAGWRAKTWTTVTAGPAATASPSPTPPTTASPTPSPTPTATPGGPGVIEGYVFDHRGRPVAGADVVVSGPAPNTAFRGVTDPSGYYRVDGLVAGQSGYQASAAAAGWGAWPARGALTPAAGDTTRTDFYLPPAFNVVVDGGFELGLDGWTLGGSMAPQADPSAGLASSGTGAAVLGRDFKGEASLGGGGNSTLSQPVTIGPDWPWPTLSLVYRMQTEESDAGHDWFEVLVVDGMSRTDLLPGEWRASGDWRFAWYDLSAWRGKTVTLVFNLWQSSPDWPTRVWLDEIAVGPAQAPDVTPRAFLPFVGRRD